MIDVHCHYHLAEEPHLTLFQARAAGVDGFGLGGTDPEGWERQVEVASEHPDVVFSIGLHPWWVAGASQEELDAALEKLAWRLDVGWKHPISGTRHRPWAVGEIGIDRSGRTPKDSHHRQHEAFVAQLSLARAHELPVVIHEVRAPQQVQDALRASGDRIRGFVHGFSGSSQVAQRYMSLGLHLSFGPLIKNPKAAKARGSVRAVRRSRLLVETDRDGQPHRPGSTWDPFELSEVLDELCTIRRRPRDTIEPHVADSAHALLGIPRPR